MVTYFRLAALFICLFELPLSQADDDDDRQASSASATEASLSSQSAQLERAGVRTQVLQAANGSAEVIAQGTILDLTPLLNLRQQYLTTLAQQDGARAKYHESALSLQRTQQLHQQDIVATRRLHEQQALQQTDKASLTAISYQQQSLLASSRLQWGERLTQWFTQPSDKAIASLLHGKTQLLSVTLPTNTSLKAPEMIYVAAHGQRNQALSAKLIEAAPQVDPVNLSQKLFYQLNDSYLPLGSALTVWLPDNRKVQNAVVIPQTAVVWHQGQAMVFIKNSNGSVAKQLLQQFSTSADGNFVSSSLQVGDEIVVNGAQTLLSQQLKNQIPTEDND